MEDPLTESAEKAAWKRNASESGFRLLFIILFGAIIYLAMIVVVALVVFQLGNRFITGNVNTKLQHFGKGLNAFVHEVLEYLTFNTDRKPFPFADWPSGSDSL
ncbi:MAG: DUF4389 domain-containing protein [Gammaproteobacteria bacterium]|nr:DUF4389 domain-containing protein [Gammaproteobacteria bacterium]MYD76778.1 DUF4389 domain-containing protein [Gammaproteobacteria bacterium]MYJ52761.1 DUF4389 domain-containing protein [Gammaproteobacteria bacterium]